MIKKSMVQHVISMARGILVVDENLDKIHRELEKHNIRVLRIKPGTDDDYIKEHSLPGRIFVTNNTKDFLDGAAEFEYGIISTEGVKLKDPELLAKKISDEIIKNNLWSKLKGFVLYLKDDGRSVFKELK
jgi:hypothetical protein